MRANLPRQELLLALHTWAYYSGAAELPRETYKDAITWLRSCWEAGEEHLPLHLVHDLGMLLLRGSGFRFASSASLGKWPEEERQLRLAYEDRVLGKWAVDPSILAAHIEIAGMRPSHQEAAISHAIYIALARPLSVIEELPAGNAAHLRVMSLEFLAKLPESFDGWEPLDPEWRAWGLVQLDLCTKALSMGRLFEDEDLWEIAHFPQLPSESARLSLREMNTAAARIGAIPPAMALDVERKAQEVPIDIDTSDLYPAGGFDALSTKGAFENMVRTEVSYVGEGATEKGGIDLFDVRFVEGELLFYTRDESPLLDARRDITWVIDRPADLRHKHPLLPAQTLVLVQGAALMYQADLLRLFGPAGSFMQVVWRVESLEDQKVAEEELPLLSLAWTSELAHERVALSISHSWENLPTPGRIIFSPLTINQKLRKLAWIQLKEETWKLGDEAFDLSQGYTAVRALLNQILLINKRG
jgi:hypothetical protein